MSENKYDEIVKLIIKNKDNLIHSEQRLTLNLDSKHYIHIDYSVDDRVYLSSIDLMERDIHFFSSESYRVLSIYSFDKLISPQLLEQLTELISDLHQKRKLNQDRLYEENRLLVLQSYLNELRNNHEETINL